jgi:hypothetical protein
MGEFDYLFDEAQRELPGALQPVSEFGYLEDEAQINVRNNLSAVNEVQPEKAAQAYSWSKITGWPMPVARDNPKDVKKAAELQQNMLLVNNLPVTTEYFNNFEAAEISQDDIGALGVVENTIKAAKKGKQAYRAGQDIVTGGHLYSTLADNLIRGIEDPDLDAKIKEFEAGRAKSPEADSISEEVVTKAAETLPFIIQVAGKSAPSALGGAATYGALATLAGPASPVTVPAATAAGAAIHGRAAAVQEIFNIERGNALNEYLSIRDENGEPINPRLAAIAASMVGAANAGLEFAGLSLIARLFPGGTKLLGSVIREPVKKALQNPTIRSKLKDVLVKYTTAIVGESSQEMLQEVTTILGGEIQKSLEESFEGKIFKDISIEDHISRVLTSGRDAAFATVGLGFPGVAIRTYQAVNQVEESKTFIENQDNLFEAVQETKTKERSPDHSENHLDLLLAQDEKDIYVDASINELFQGTTEEFEAVFTVLGVDPVEAKKMIESGQDVKISKSALNARLDIEQYKTVREYLKSSPEALSESQRIQLESELSELSGRVQEMISEEDQEDAEIAEHRQRIRNEIIGTGRTKEYADSVLELLDRFQYSRFDKLDLLKNYRIRRAQEVVTEEGIRTVDIKTIEEKTLTQKVKELFQPPKKRGSVQFAEDGKTIIRTFEKSDLSTVLHETGHIFLREMEDLVSLDNANPQISTDLETLREWAGVEPGKQFHEEAEEKFARGFEAYLREGKAPVAALDRVFYQFRQWLLNVYKSLRQLNVELTDGVREVFDRMFTADEEVKASIEKNDMTMPSKQWLDSMGVVSADREYMQRLLVEMERKAVQEMEWDRNRKRVGLRKQWREIAKADIANNKTYIAWKSLRDGVGISEAEVANIHGADAVLDLKEKGLTKDGGVLPSEAASLFGYDSEFQIIDDLYRAVSPKLAEEQLIAEQSNRYDAQFRAEDYLADTEEYGEFLRVRGKYVERNAGRPFGATPSIAFRRHAEKLLNEQKVRDATQHHKFMSKMRQYSNQEVIAARKGDLVKSVQANEQARLSYEFSRGAVRNRKEVEKIIKRGKKYGGKKPNFYENEFRESILYLVSRFGLGTPTMVPHNPETANQKLQDIIRGSFESRLDPFIAPPVLLSPSTEIESYRDLRMEDMSSLGDLLQYLDANGKSSKEKVLRDGRNVEEVSTEMSLPSQESRSKKVISDDRKLKKYIEGVRQFWSRFNSINFIMTSMGGYVSLGKGNKLSSPEIEVTQLLTDAADSRQQVMEKYVNRMQSSYLHILKRIRKMGNNKIRENVPPTPAIMKNSGQLEGWYPSQIFAMAMHIGNDSNRGRIFSGFPGFEQAHLDQLLKFLDTKDMDAIQDIWDIYDEMFEEVNEVHNRINKYEIKKIEAVPFVFKGKDYRGGYSPIRYDTRMAVNADQIKVENIARINEQTDLMARAESKFQIPATKNGSLKARVETTSYPLLLSLEPISAHVIDSAHYISHAEAIRDADNLTHTDVFRAAVKDHLGSDVYLSLREILKRIANPKSTTSDPQMDQLAGRLRRMATAWMLAYNKTVAAKQAASSFSAATKLGKFRWITAYLGTALNATGIREKYDFMMESSTYMKARMKGFDHDFSRQIKLLSPNQKALIFGDKTITWDDIVDIGFLPIRMIDTATVLPIWTEAYNQEMKRRGTKLALDHEIAVKFADNLIRSTQPSAQPVDLTLAQSDKGIWQLLSMFGTFTIGKYQQRTRMNWRAMRSKAISKPKYAEMVFLENIVPAIAISVVSLALKDELDDEDIWGKIGLGAMQQALAPMVPVLGNALYPFTNYTYSISPIESLINAGIKPGKKSVKEASKGNWSAAAKESIWTLATVWSIRNRVPVTKLIDKFREDKK